MITDPATLAALLETTADLIAHDRVSVVLKRSGWERTASAGFRKTTTASLAAQDFFFGAVTVDPPIRELESGEQIYLRHVLVGMPDADIEEKDEFTIGGRDFKVHEVHPDASYERRAWCIERD